MKEFVVYTAARLAVFVACYAAVLAVTALVAGRDAASGLWPLVVAVVVSGVVSAVALRGLREAVTARVHARADRIVTNGRQD